MQHNRRRIGPLLAAGLALFLALATAAPAVAQRRHMPPIRNWNSLRITLERGPCLGRCPVYRVTVRGDGGVVFEGRKFERAAGRHTRRIPRARVRQLFRAFHKAGFFGLEDRYTAFRVRERPTKRLTLTYDGHSKTVVDYAGLHAGMPKSVDRLERLVDRIAGTEHWVKRDRR